MNAKREIDEGFGPLIRRPEKVLGENEEDFSLRKMSSFVQGDPQVPNFFSQILVAALIEKILYPFKVSSNRLAS